VDLSLGDSGEHLAEAFSRGLQKYIFYSIKEQPNKKNTKFRRKRGCRCSMLSIEKSR
jgi:hypothetical protein